MAIASSWWSRPIGDAMLPDIGSRTPPRENPTCRSISSPAAWIAENRIITSMPTAIPARA